MCAATSHDSAIQEWINAAEGRTEDGFDVQNERLQSIQRSDLTASPVTLWSTYVERNREFRIPPFPLGSLPGLSLALAVWVRQHPTVTVFPASIGDSWPYRFRGCYHPGWWRRNTAVTSRDHNLQYGLNQSFREGAPHRPAAEVRDTWREIVDAENVQCQPKDALNDDADNLSWDDVLAVGMAYWIDLHPYAVVLPMPVLTADDRQCSSYHPQSWVVNDDSPFLHADLGNEKPQLTPPKHFTQMDEPLQLAPELSDDNESGDQDPFAEFR